MKCQDQGYSGFGEAYFSMVAPGVIKGWKRHRVMTLNLVVPIGKIRFVLFDDRDEHNKVINEFILSKDNYYRLTVPPMIWVGFQGLSKSTSMLLNIASIPHDITESENKNITQIEFDWDSN